MIAKFSSISQQHHFQIQVRDKDRLFELVTGGYARMQLADNADHLVAQPRLGPAPRVQEARGAVGFELESRQSYGLGDRFDGALHIIKIDASSAIRRSPVIFVARARGDQSQPLRLKRPLPSVSPEAFADLEQARVARAVVEIAFERV